MRRTPRQPAGFALIAATIFACGLLSALIDGTLGWEHLAEEFLLHLAQ